MERTLVADVSFYQDAASTPYKPDFAFLKRAGIQGIIIRHSQNGSLDRMFEWYWNETQVHLVPTMTYGLLQYWQGSLDSGLQGKFLGDWFLNKQKIRAWCDFERPNANYPALPPRQNCLDMIHNWMFEADKGTRMESGLYTNLDTIKYLSPIPDWLLARPFWLAWPVATPTGVSPIEFTRNMSFNVSIPFHRWLLTQFSWLGPGEEAGFESKGLDIDWFEGSYEVFCSFCSFDLPIPPDPIIPIPPDPIIESNDSKMRKLVLKLADYLEDLPD